MQVSLTLAQEKVVRTILAHAKKGEKPTQTQIAKELGIKQPTVGIHIGRIRQKIPEIDKYLAPSKSLRLVEIHL